MPQCFDMPTAATKLKAFAAKQDRMAFVRKPEGAWGGRGIEIRFGIDDLIPDGQEHEDAQCLGLTEADDPQAFASKEACSHMAYKRKMMTLEELSRAEVIRAITQVIRAARWALDVRLAAHGIAHHPTLSTLVDGKEGAASLQRAVVQQYIVDPVQYRLEGIWPPITVKTDIRIYGTVVSMDPFRFYVSEYGYFRSGFLEKNYSAQRNEDFEELSVIGTETMSRPKESESAPCPQAWLMEIHPTLAIKSPGLGDPEAGWAWDPEKRDRKEL
ncbi:Tubulin polyglutamylase ttll6 [Durusdinium trenchii]|uniref:Tubulin polyglutamylase ttll6 n=1 Tax=Durusdinium trenchii TaxID=1381693 RepID=A0ABP0QFX0_9DINO